MIPVVTIKEKTVEEVCPIFERINSSGVHLDVFDLMVAATWTDDFDLNDEVLDIRESAKLKDFENLENTIYLKIMAAIQGFGSKKDGILKLRELHPERLTELSIMVKTSVERAVDFLSTDLAVPSDAFLPYENQLVVYSYFFSKVKNPVSTQLDVLRRWFWQSGFLEHYRGAVEGILEQDLAAVDKLIQGDSDALKMPFNLTKRDLLSRQFVIQGSLAKTFAVMLARKNPMNITNGCAIDTQNSLSIYNSKEFHHIFPSDFLKGLGVEKGKRNNICNICILSASQNKYVSKKAPSEYLAECSNGLGDKAKEVFESNIIPFGPNAYWENDDYEMFLDIRADLILEEIKRVW